MKKHTHMRLDPDLWERAKKLGKKKHRTFTGVVEIALEEYLTRNEKQKAA